jgi:hypothetical protein
MTIDIITEDRDSNEHVVNRMSYEVYTIPVLATLNKLIEDAGRRKCSTSTIIIGSTNTFTTTNTVIANANTECCILPFT